LEYHDLNPDCSRTAWDSILECMLSECNWVNQAQLKQPWSFYSDAVIMKFTLASALHD